MPLHRTEILRRLARKTSDRQALVVTPLVHNPDPIDEDSIDLRLGTKFLQSRSDRLAAHVPGFAKKRNYREVHVPLGQHLVLPGHQTVLAATLEFIRLPNDVSAMVLTKSSWARNFISVESAPWVHARYRGCLTLEITNSSEIPVLLYPGVRIAQLVLFELAMSEDDLLTCLASDRLVGSFVGPTRPEPAKLKRPDNELREAFGVSDVAWPEIQDSRPAEAGNTEPK